MRSSLPSTSAIDGSSAPGLELGELGGGGRLDLEHLADFVLDVGEPALGGVAALLAARRFGARFADRFERGARGLVGFGKVGSRPAASRSAAARRAAVAVSISPISAWRWSANFCGAFFSSVRSLRRPPRCAAPMVAIWVAALSLRSFQACRSAAIACSRRSASSASRAIACASTRTSASAPRSLRDHVVDRGELGFELGGGGQRGERLLVASRGRRSLRRGRRRSAPAPP